MSQRQLAAELGVSLGGVNYALKALVERGFVKADNFRKSGSKVAYLYFDAQRDCREDIAGHGFFWAESRRVRSVEARN